MPHRAPAPRARRLAALLAAVVPLAGGLTAPAAPAAAQAVPAATRAGGRVPTVDDLVALQSVGNAALSPDGRWVAYGVTAADMERDAFVTQLWVADARSGERRQLTRGDRSTGSYKWSPDGRWVGFTSDRVGGKAQLFAIRPDGGEPVQLTAADGGVNDYEWSPSGTQVAFASPPPAAADRARRDRYGDFEVVRRDYAHAQLFTADVDSALRGGAFAPQAGRQRTRGSARHVASFAWSPDGRRIAFAAPVSPDLVQGATSDVYVLTLDPGAAAACAAPEGCDAVRRVVDLAGPDGNPRWSPDGRQIVFTSAMGRPNYFALNTRLAVVDAEGGTPRSLTDAFDESPGLVAWRPEGVYFSALQRTAAHLFRVDPRTGRVTRVSAPDALMGSGFTLSADGRRAAFVVASPSALPEVAVAELAGPAFSHRALTDMSAQARGLALGTREVIRWRSRDGAEVEGVLVKPADFDPARRYPLLCVIHGGPTGVDRPALPDARYYPVDAWVGRGALVLKVNYRGSAGYGERFRTLNVRNLGVGDAWDVLSGIDTLVARGWADPDRLGCMGWSQGGYISAFLTTSTTRFKAISVGAGISNWSTYYYNTDITPFTINYLGANPVDDPEVYRLTSPMSYVKGARTPTLIQHGELDRRVPIANAYELRQALEDRGVPVEMVVYKGFGHGITKPRAQRAVMEHNLGWFNHYVFGDPLPDFAAGGAAARAAAR